MAVPGAWIINPPNSPSLTSQFSPGSSPWFKGNLAISLIKNRYFPSTKKGFGEYDFFVQRI
jgi:hypothetical protein